MLNASCAGTFLHMASACVFLISGESNQFLLRGGGEGCKCKAALDLELKETLSAFAFSAASGLIGGWLCREAMLQLEKPIASILI